VNFVNEIFTSLSLRRSARLQKYRTKHTQVILVFCS